MAEKHFNPRPELHPTNEPVQPETPRLLWRITGRLSLQEVLIMAFMNALYGKAA